MDRQRVDIGGVTLDAILSGHGNVTVVFANGLATSLEEWDGVVDPIAKRARTMRYDRRRAPARGPVPVRSAEDMADDLAKLLTALKLVRRTSSSDIAGAVPSRGSSRGGIHRRSRASSSSTPPTK